MTNRVQYGSLEQPTNTTTTMSPEEIRRHNEDTRRAQFDAQSRVEAAKAAERQQKLEADIASAVSNNKQLQGYHTGYRANTTGGRIEIERTNPDIAQHQGPMRGYIAQDPMALPLNIGGIQLSPTQAREWLADGSVSREEYSRAVTEAMQVYRPGYRHSFR